MALAYPFQQNIIEQVFGVSSYTTDWYLGLWAVGAIISVDGLTASDSGISLMGLPDMMADAAENAVNYPAVSNAEAFDYLIDAEVTVGGWYICNSPTPTDADLAFYAAFSNPIDLADGDTLHWLVNSLVVEFWG